MAPSTAAAVVGAQEAGGVPVMLRMYFSGLYNQHLNQESIANLDEEVHWKVQVPIKVSFGCDVVPKPRCGPESLVGLCGLGRGSAAKARRRDAFGGLLRFVLLQPWSLNLSVCFS